MRIHVFISIILLSSPLISKGQDVDVVKFDAVESLLKSESNKVSVINFWATWCGPCIKEMPYFEQALEDRKSEINLYFISLDYADELDKVNSFVSRRAVRGEVMILDELDYNSWIDLVDPSWSGAIPATLFINPSTGERIFVENPLTREEIDQHINDLL